MIALFLLAALLIAALPVTFIVTVLLYPLWSWIESSYGIESVGHSGPAEWCFMLVYAVCVAAFLPLVWRGWRRSGKETRSTDSGKAS